MLITFSGLDGSGKSTLIAWLKADLEQRHRPVTVLHMPDAVGVYACLRAVRDRVVGRRAPGGNGTAAAGRAASAAPAGQGSWRRRLGALASRARNAVVWSRPIRRLLYPIDLALFAAVWFYVVRLRNRILVMDRYFYDVLVDVADDGRWFWVRLLEHLTPTPDVAVFLDITPEEAYGRKGEYSVPYLARRSTAYRTVASLVPSALVLPNVDLARTQRALEQTVSERVRS